MLLFFLLLLTVPFDGNCPELQENELVIALHSAVSKARPKLVASLLAQGADVNARNMTSGATVLHEAALRCCLKIVELLVTAGAEVDVYDYQGYTPHDYATKKQCTKIIALLSAQSNKTLDSETTKNQDFETPQKVFSLAADHSENEA